MLIEIRHEKPLGKRFDVYCGDTLLEGGEEYDIPAEGAALRFVERNPAVGKRWPLLLLGHFLASLFGAPDSLQEIGRSRTEICVDLGKVEGDELSIVFLEGGKGYRIEGAPKALPHRGRAKSRRTLAARGSPAAGGAAHPRLSDRRYRPGTGTADRRHRPLRPRGVMRPCLRSVNHRFP